MRPWNDADYIVFDFETSGRLPEFSLQPWRIAKREAWATSLVSLEIIDGKKHFAGGVVHSDEIPEDEGRILVRRYIQDMLTKALDENKTLVGWNLVFDIQVLIAYGFEDLVFKSRFLDGMLLWRHARIEPEYDLDRSKKRSYGLKTFVEEHMPEQAGYEADIDFHDSSVEARARLHKYNKQDNVATFVGARHWYSCLESNQLRAALIEAESLPMVARANLRGMPVDTLVCNDLSLKLQRDAAIEAAKLAEHGVTEIVVRSPLKLAKVVFDDWGLPVLKENKGKKTGKISRATDKEVLHELAFLDPRAKSLRLYREALNNRTKFAEAPILSTMYCDDGATHPQAHIFGTYCVRGDTEVLTRDGWVPIKTWSGGEIMQVQPDLNMRFAHAELHQSETTEWIEVPKLGEAWFTKNHTMPYLAQKTFAWRTQYAEDWLGSGEAKYVPVAGFAQLDGDYTPNQMRLFAAVQADGYSTPRYLKFTFKKARKIDRLKRLLDACSVKYREYVCDAYPDRTEITITKTNRPNWLQHDKKTLGPWLLNTTLEGLEAFVAEVVHWDGSPHPDGGVKYSSALQSNLDWVVTAAALVGKKAFVHTSCSAHISDERAIRSVLPKQNRLVTLTSAASAYCPVTETGFWLARHEGRIFVTGNSGRMTYSSKQGKNKDERPIGFALHQEKNDKAFRAILVPPPGYGLLEFDAAGQEFRWMAIASGDETMLSLCEPGEDPHSYMGARVINVDYHKMIELKETDKEMKAGRKLGKVGNLSLQYRTSAKKLRVVARVQYDIPMEMPEANRIHFTYQRTYPGVPKYWTRQIAETKRLGYVETFAGRRVQVIGDWAGSFGWSMGSTAINYRIQGTGADQKYLAFACIKNYLTDIGAYFAWDLHDGIYIFCPVEKMQRAAIDIKLILDHLPYKKAWGFVPPIPMPWDCKSSLASWGDLKEMKFD